MNTPLADPRIELSDFPLDSDANSVTLTWASSADAVYFIDAAPTFTEVTDWEELLDDVDSEGETTSVTVTINGLFGATDPNNPGTLVVPEKAFFRVREAE